MAYVAAAEFAGAQGFLTQVDITDVDTLARVNAILGYAEDIVDSVLEFSYAGVTSGTDKTVRSQYGAYFVIPPHDQGTVTAVVSTGGTDLDGYWEELDSGVLYAVDSYGNEGNWNRARYVVTADWGYGDVPDRVKEVTLELAVNIWRSAESGNFSDVVGASDGGAVGYEKNLTARQRMILKDAARRVRPQVV